MSQVNQRFAGAFAAPITLIKAIADTNLTALTSALGTKGRDVSVVADTGNGAVLVAVGDANSVPTAGSQRGIVLQAGDAVTFSGPIDLFQIKLKATAAGSVTATYFPV